jgi:16S rRNA (cytosine967-C5)-methyltransferase
MSLEPARLGAWDVLASVARGGRLEPALERALARLTEERERRLLAELVKGTLVWRARYDRLIEAFSRRAPTRDSRLLDVLRLGLHQLLDLDGVPAHAAIDQSGELARARIGAAAVGYVNGLLRAVHRAVAAAPDRRDEILHRYFPAPDRDPGGFIASWYSFPLWLVERWLARLGFAACAELCTVLNRRPPLVLHALAPSDPAALASELAVAGWATVPSPLHARALVVTGRPSRSQLHALLARSPRLIVQDGAAQAATAYLIAASDGPAADLCAAPGGKTFHWAAARPAARPLVALDRNRRRLRQLVAAAKTVEAGPSLVLWGDARRPPLAPESFASVLLDAPCTGTGVIRRHPEARWRISAERVTASGLRLLELARAAARLVRPGGRLLYATCSLEPEENEDVIEALLAERTDLRLEPAVSDGSDRGARRWWPHRDGGDGFFAARLRREAVP